MVHRQTITAYKSSISRGESDSWDICNIGRELVTFGTRMGNLPTVHLPEGSIPLNSVSFFQKTGFGWLRGFWSFRERILPFKPIPSSTLSAPSPRAGHGLHAFRVLRWASDESRGWSLCRMEYGSKLLCCRDHLSPGHSWPASTRRRMSFLKDQFLALSAVACYVLRVAVYPLTTSYPLTLKLFSLPPS